MQHLRLLATLIMPLALYGCDQNAPTITESSKTELTESASEIKSPEASTSDVQNTLEQQTINNTAIFDEYEFSTVEEASLNDEVEEITGPYCLGPSSTKEKTGEITNSACLQISNRLASVSNEGCLAANLAPTQCFSVQKFPILVTEFPPLENKAPQGRILVIGGTHGDELTSVSMIFRWIEKLNKFHSGLFHWHLVPMMNPDGVLNPEATRTNANGVDLNRNLPSNDWEENALKYWQEKTAENPRRFPGESPSSEPETQWLIDEINDFKPDVIISVHAPYGVVDFDAQVLNAAPKNLGRLLLNLLGTYPGSLGNYAGINRNIPVITLELPHAWVMPSDAETTKLWEDIVAWLRENINAPEVKSL